MEKITLFVLLAAAVTFSFIGCSKGDGDDNVIDENIECGVTTVFKFADFEVYNVKVEPNSDNSSVRVEYNVKNTTNQEYVPDDENGEFMVYIKMKASDGAWYDYEHLLNSDINAGASVSGNYTFGVPAEGMTLDPNSFTYEVQCR